METDSGSSAVTASMHTRSNTASKIGSLLDLTGFGCSWKDRLFGSNNCDIVRHLAKTTYGHKLTIMVICHVSGDCPQQILSLVDKIQQEILGDFEDVKRFCYSNFLCMNEQTIGHFAKPLFGRDCSLAHGRCLSTWNRAIGHDHSTKSNGYAHTSRRSLSKNKGKDQLVPLPLCRRTFFVLGGKCEQEPLWWKCPKLMKVMKGGMLYLTAETYSLHTFRPCNSTGQARSCNYSKSLCSDKVKPCPVCCHANSFIFLSQDDYEAETDHMLYSWTGPGQQGSDEYPIRASRSPKTKIQEHACYSHLSFLYNDLLTFSPNKNAWNTNSGSAEA